MDNILKPMIFNLSELEIKAKKGDKLACYILGRSYDSEENGAEQSFEKAMYWYERGKELGDPRSAYGVGAYYYFGFGEVEIDKNKAFEVDWGGRVNGKLFYNTWKFWKPIWKLV